MSTAPFADRLAALVEERRSQICLGLDPDPQRAGSGTVGASAEDGGGAAARMVAEWAGRECRELIATAGPACVAVKPQLACFERLGVPGRRVLGEVCEAAREAGLLVVADGKRGDVPVTAAAYGQSLVGTTQTPWGDVGSLGVDAFTANPLLGRDAVEPLVEAALEAAAGVFFLVRTSNPGAAEVQDLIAGGRPVHEHLAALVDSFAADLAGGSGLSGSGAVVGATAPEHLPRLRELMPRSIFLLPGVGAQGGRPEQLGPAFEPGAAGAIVTASRSIAGESDPGYAAARLRDAVWEISAR